MKKGKKLKQWEAAICILLIPTVAMLAILLFFVPPVLEQYDWVRPEDLDKPVEYLHLMIQDEKLYDAEYSVKQADGTLERVESNVQTEGFRTAEDPNGKESDSLLTLAQAQDLIEPLWNLAASAGHWDMADVSLTTPRTVSVALSKVKVEATLSVSTGKLTMIEQTTVKETDLGVMSIWAVDQSMTKSFSASVLLVP